MDFENTSPPCWKCAFYAVSVEGVKTCSNVTLGEPEILEDDANGTCHGFAYNAIRS